MSVWHRWAIEVDRTDGGKSRLLEQAQVVGTAGEVAAVHIDARDSCELPRVTGGLAWRVTIHAPSGEAAKVHSIDDLDDGTYRVRFTPPVAGKYQLEAQVHGSHQGGFSSSVDVLPARQ